MPNQAAIRERTAVQERTATRLNPLNMDIVVKQRVKVAPETVQESVLIPPDHSLGESQAHGVEPVVEKEPAISSSKAPVAPVETRTRKAQPAREQDPEVLSEQEATSEATEQWFRQLATKNDETQEPLDPVGAQFGDKAEGAFKRMDDDIARSDEWRSLLAAYPSKAEKAEIEKKYAGDPKLPESLEMPILGSHREELEALLPLYRKAEGLGLKSHVFMEVNGLVRASKNAMLEGLDLPNGKISTGIIRGDKDNHRKSTGHEVGMQFTLMTEKLSREQAVSTLATLLNIPKGKVDDKMLRRFSPDDDTYTSFVRDSAEYDQDALAADVDGDGSVGTLGKTMVKAPEGGYRPGIFRINDEKAAIELASQDVSVDSSDKPGIGIRLTFKGADLVRTGGNLLLDEEADSEERLQAKPETLGVIAGGIINGEDGYAFEDKRTAELKQEIADLKARLDSENSAALHGLDIKYLDMVLEPFASAQDRPAEKRIPELKEFADVMQNEKFQHRLQLRGDAGDNPHVVVVPLDTADRADWLERLSAGERKKYFASDGGFIATQKLLAQMSERAVSSNGVKQYALLITSRPRKGFEIAGLSTTGEIVDEWFPTSKSTKKA